MADNISLVKVSQNDFSNKIKNLKQNLKESNVTITEFKKKQSNGKGIICLKNIPPGFEEQEMREYFRQFGKVLSVRLVRSKKTGKSKGYAFILFELEEVAKIASETMHNYLMYNHLLKATFYPSNHKFERKFRQRKITKKNCLKNRNLNKIKSNMNKTLSDEIITKRLNRRKSALAKRLINLKNEGIDYNFELSSTTTTSKKNAVNEKDMPILIIDADEKDVIFKTPPNVIKKIIKNGKVISVKSSKRNLTKTIAK